MIEHPVGGSFVLGLREEVSFVREREGRYVLEDAFLELVKGFEVFDLFDDSLGTYRARIVVGRGVGVPLLPELRDDPQLFFLLGMEAVASVSDMSRNGLSEGVAPSEPYPLNALVVLPKPSTNALRVVLSRSFRDFQFETSGRGARVKRLGGAGRLRPSLRRVEVVAVHENVRMERQKIGEKRASSPLLSDDDEVGRLVRSDGKIAYLAEGLTGELLNGSQHESV